MRTLVFADVHANLAALEAVIQAAQPFDRCVFLGDAVGFGPEPEACVQRLRGLRPVAWVRGNHDLPSRRHDPPPRGPIASGRTWEAWTRAQLTPQSRTFLESQPDTARLDLGDGAARLLHYFDGLTQRVTPGCDLSILDASLGRIEEPQVWFGHSHHALQAERQGRRLLNPGAVGQPRDGDARASYAIHEDGRITLHRVAYDVERTVAALDRIPFSDAFRDRWVRNFREGVVGPGSG